MSVLARVFELRVSERSDSRTANLVDVCANLLFIPVGDQGSIFRVGFSFVSVLNSTRSTIFGARPLVTQDWGSSRLPFEDLRIDVSTGMIDCKHSQAPGTQVTFISWIGLTNGRFLQGFASCNYY